MTKVRIPVGVRTFVRAVGEKDQALGRLPPLALLFLRVRRLRERLLMMTPDVCLC